MTVYAILKSHRYQKLRYKLLLLIFLIGFLIMVYYKTGFIHDHHQSPEAETKVNQCEVSSRQRRLLFALLKKTDEILMKLNILHFLCYDSLWGAIQESGPLPWHLYANLCLMGSHIKPYDEASFYRAFKLNNLHVLYSSADGEYTIKNVTFLSSTSDAPYVKLFLFEDDDRINEMLRRVGWKRRFLAPDCDAQPLLQCFPAHMAANPLPLKTFGPLSLPSPREEIELLKLHYPKSWWKPRKPAC